MSISPRVLAEMPGVSAYHRVLLIGTPFARKSPSADGFEFGGLFSRQQSPTQISVGLSAHETTYKPSRSF
jgi:hypothetical protein